MLHRRPGVLLAQPGPAQLLLSVQVSNSNRYRLYDSL